MGNLPVFILILGFTHFRNASELFFG